MRPGQELYHAAKHCECWAPTPAAEPLGPRKTIGQLRSPADMYRPLAAELMICGRRRRGGGGCGPTAEATNRERGWSTNVSRTSAERWRCGRRILTPSSLLESHRFCNDNNNRLVLPATIARTSGPAGGGGVASGHTVMGNFGGILKGTPGGGAYVIDGLHRKVEGHELANRLDPPHGRADGDATKASLRDGRVNNTIIPVPADGAARMSSEDHRAHRLTGVGGRNLAKHVFECWDGCGIGQERRWAGPRSGKAEVALLEVEIIDMRQRVPRRGQEGRGK